MSNKANKLCQGKDAFERINFLHQAASTVAGKHNPLSCYYGQLCKSIAKKAVLRLLSSITFLHPNQIDVSLFLFLSLSFVHSEPEMKRTLCKGCGVVLKPTQSASLDIKTEQNGKTQVCEVVCSICQRKKRFVLNKNYDLWFDNPKSIKDTIVMDSSVTNHSNKKSK